MLAAEAIPTNNDEYVLRNIAVICPDCGSVFSTPCMANLPPVAEDDKIEGDLHRVLPDAELRASLIAVCPYCNCATWTARCTPSNLNADIFPTSEIGHSKKFALAVKYARAKDMDPLDIAFIAVNGLYCAREAGENDQLWLELTAYEQSRGLAQEFRFPDAGQDHLMMAELWRQLQSFERALPEYDLAAKDDFIPRELLDYLKQAALAGNHQPVLLPPHVVRAVFPDAAAAKGPAKQERRVPKNIVRVQSDNRVEQFFANVPPDRKQILSAAGEEFLATESDGQDDGTTVEMSATPVLYAVEDDEESSAFDYASDAQDEAVPGEQTPPEPVENTADTAATSAGSAPNSVDPFERVRKLVAMPQGASSISVVQAMPAYGNGPSVSVAAAQAPVQQPESAKKPERLEAHLPPIQPPSEYLPNATSPEASASAHASSQRALRRAMKKAAQEEGDKFPEIQITDEESGYAYTQPPVVQEVQQADQTQGTQAQAQQQQQAQQQGQGANPQEAIARVESFLSLTRQPSYQSWIRGYRK